MGSLLARVSSYEKVLRWEVVGCCMSRKGKGIAAERELIHLLWKTGVFAAVRVAGSGAIKYPVPDIVALSSSKRFAIECKAARGDVQYVDKKEVDDLVRFASMTGVLPIIAVRFDRVGWFFLSPDALRNVGNSFVVRKDELEFRSLSFEELVGKSVVAKDI